MTTLRVRSKTWLEIDGQPFLGDGRYRLLSAVQRHGSINAAAKELGISYRKAWTQLQALEASSPFPLLVRRTGGSGGGSSHVTSVTLALLQRFETLREQVNREADRCFAAAFAEGDGHDDA